MSERNQNESTGQQQLKDQKAEKTFDQADKQDQQQPLGQSQRSQPQTKDPSVGGATGNRSEGSFVGSQGQDSSEYLQQSGTPESGFAEKGQGASDQSDIERGKERSENRESDVEGSSDDS